ncbi:MAG: two-component regulator propeller domain-containing protein [Bacteroidota bacterium]
MLKLTSILFITLLLLVQNGLAQQKEVPPSFHFEIFDLPNNELGNHVQTIAQDSFGFIWFGSQYGLHRWDGYKFKTYLHDPLDSISISSSYVEHIHVAKDGSLWLGTWGGGLNHFDPSTEIFTSYFHDAENPNSLSNNFVSDVLEDRDGNIWIATQYGVNRFNPKTKKFKHFKHNPNDSRSLSYDICSKIFLDSEGILWFGTGWVWEESEAGGLNRYHSKTENFTRYTHDPKNNNSLISNKVMEIFEDSKGNFWVGTAGDGLHLMNRQSGTFKRSNNTAERSGKLSTPRLYTASDWHMRFVFEDREQKLWFGAWLGGIKYFDPTTNEIEHYFAGRPNASLPDDFVWDMFQSKDGTLWGHTAGKSAKVFKVVKESTLFNYVPITPESQVYIFHPEENGDLWVGTKNTGLLNLNAERNYSIIYKDDPKKPVRPNEENHVLQSYERKSRLFDNIVKIESDDEGYLWLKKEYGKYSGLLRFHPQKGEITPFFYQPDVSLDDPTHYVIADILKDEQGRIWVSTGNGELHLYEAQNQSFCSLGKPQNRTFEEWDSFQIKMAKGQNGKIWLSGINKYVDESTFPFIWQFDANTEEFSSLDLDMRVGKSRYKEFVYGLEEDQQGNLWIATQYALRKVNPTNSSVEFFNSTQFGASNFRGLVLDEKDNVWLMGDGLVVFDPLKGESFTYHADSGIKVLPCYLGAISKGKDGKIYIGGRSGFQYFEPEKLRDQSTKNPPQVIITDFQLLNKPYVKNGVQLFPNNADENTVIELRHDEDVFTFSFAALNFLQPESNRHEYRLLGHDTNWRLTGLEPKVTYIKVPPGEYSFQVRAANHEGVWGETQSVDIKILPPWWKTWWAYTLVSLLVLGILFSVYRFQVTRQLAKAEATRLKELDAARTQLYTNITHEFRTPLTVILGMAQQVKNNPKEHFRSGLDMIARNGESLLDLINQMLDLSKIENGKLSLKLIQGDIVSYLRYLVESFHSFAENKDIQIHFLSDLEAKTMDYDPEKVQQIISNLLSNAVKFTSAGGNIYLSVGQSEQQQLWVKVKDTGKGIPEEKIPHIFDRFYQVDDSNTKEGNGSGIGLSLTKELVHLMNGKIAVRSVLGRGTEFTVHLPINNNARYSQREILQKAAPNHIPSSKIEVLSNQNATTDLLLIEDNPDVVRYLSSCLVDRYRLHIAYDGKEGVEIAKKVVPDLIISDVMMPKKDGFEVCEILRQDERTSHIPIIMLTAKADMESKLEGLEHGADAYLAKPFQKEELLLRIKKLLELRQQLQLYYLQLVGVGKNTRIIKDIPKMELEDQFVQKVRGVVNQNLDNFDFSVEQLCKEIGMSNSQLHRKLSALTGYSATKFIRYVRLNRAKVLLQNPELTITAVAFDTGFNDPSYFGRVFKKEFGVTPMEWRSEEVIKS